MPEPIPEEFIQSLNQPESVKSNPLTFVKGGLLETETEVPKEFAPEELVLLDKQVKAIKIDLQTFIEALKIVETTEWAYPDVPFLTKSGGVSIKNENYKYLNREEKKSLEMSVDNFSVLVNRKNFEILTNYLQRLESHLLENN